MHAEAAPLRRGCEELANCMRAAAGDDSEIQGPYAYRDT
jgi:hypothetical protein